MDPAWYADLRDLGCFIGGVFALIAGGIAYLAGRIQAKATKESSNRQIEEAARKDQLQGHCLALGIYIELLAVKAEVDGLRAKIIAHSFSSYEMITFVKMADLTRTAKVSEPIFTINNSPELYLLGRSGGTIVQLISTILQYNNNIVEKTAKKQLLDGFAVKGLDEAAVGHLDAIELLLGQAMQEIKPIHDLGLDQPP